MSGHADEHEPTMAFAEIALRQIKALRQAATPRNYEVWYAYTTGYNPSLNNKINEMLSQSGGLSDSDLEQIYATYLSPTRLTDRIDKVGNQVMREIEQVMAMIDAAAGSANSYTESLADMIEKLHQSKDKDREGLRAIVESLVHTAKEMEVSNQQLEERLNASKQEINEMHENLETVRNESLTDPLTQLANCKFFDSTLESAIADARAKNEPLSLLMTDIDHFKNFNDSFGHLTGDQVLRLVAMSVKQNVKGQDTATRYGREEFAIVLPNTALRSAITVAPRGDGQGTDEALDRRTSRARDDLDRRCRLAQERQPADADRAHRRLPLCRQAPQPQPGDVRDRSQNHRQRNVDAGRVAFGIVTLRRPWPA
jgi:diguanylate cyclase